MNAFKTIVAIAVIMLAPLDTNAQPLRVLVTVDVEDIRLQEQIDSEIRRELRRWSDIRIVNTRHEFALHIVAIRATNISGEHIGSVISAIFLDLVATDFEEIQRLSHLASDLISYNKPEEAQAIMETISIHLIRGMGRAYSTPGHRLLIGGQNDIHDNIASIIADFNSEILEPERMKRASSQR